jgi:DNA-binding CsgD family transcriptional regulator
VATERDRSRCRERLTLLSDSGLDCEAIQREAIGELQRVIGFDRWCSIRGDPETLISLGAIGEHGYGPGVPRLLELEYSGQDSAARDAVARRSAPAASLSAETSGDLARSPRWDQVLRHVGIGDEAVVGCRDPFGCWGWIKLYRESSDRRFAERDLDLLADIGAVLGSALRRSLSRPSDGGVPVQRPPGVIVLDAHLRVVSLTAGARAWMRILPSAPVHAAFEMLPGMVYATATLARSPITAIRARALERTVERGWVIIEAALLEGSESDETAVTLRSATAGETFRRLCRIYALSRREREVVAALMQGLDTRALAERLFISRHTVQDHLKSVFERTGVRSRRELLATFNTSTSAR